MFSLTLFDGGICLRFVYKADETKGIGKPSAPRRCIRMDVLLVSHVFGAGGIVREKERGEGEEEKLCWRLHV